MRVVALVSGGKGTFNVYNMVQVVAQGHQVVALANLYPKQDDGMYQTVAHQGIEKLAQAMELPLYRKITPGNSRNMKASYDPAEDDEAEDLYELLQYVKEDQNVDGVAVGSIQTDYQLIRVEYVCHRLQLNSLAYLWQRDQAELLQEMIDCQVYAIIIKVAAQGLVPEIHLGKSLKEMQPHLLNMKDKYGSNVCGEGGEYDTLTLDCPLFKNRIVIDDVQMVISSADSVCCAGYLRFSKLRLVPKERVKTVVKSIVSPERETLPKQPGPNFVMPNNQKLVPASNDQITEEAITEDCATEIQLSQSPLKIIAERLSVNGGGGGDDNQGAKLIYKREPKSLTNQPRPNFVMPNNQKLVPASNDQKTEEAITEDCATEIQLSQSPLKIIAERLSVNGGGGGDDNQGAKLIYKREPKSLTNQPRPKFIMSKNQKPDLVSNGTKADNTDIDNIMSINDEPEETAETLQSKDKATTEEQELNGVPFEPFNGQRGKKGGIVVNGYVFHVDKRTQSSTLYKCSNRSTCRARFQVRSAIGTFKNSEHTHPPHTLLIAKSEMKQALKLECASRKSETGCFETVRNIFDRVSNKPEHQDAAKHIRYKSVATTMRKARTSCFPLSPKTPDEFHRLMTTEKAAGFRTIGGEQFYHGYDGNTLYFVVPETMKAIEKAESTVLFLDGTFKTKPVMFNQLFMAYAQVYGKVFPLAFMPSAGSMKTDTYISILNKIRTLIAPGKVKTIVTDFEKALMQACRTVYPEATLQGCLFHYKQAVRRKIIKLGISQNSETYFEYRLAMQLAYLPANKIATSIDFVINKIKQNTADDTTAEIFGQYLWSQWVCSVAPEIYSVYKVPTTTNNAAESYHAKMLSEIGCSPTPWAFVEKIILLAKNVNLEIGRAQNLPFKRQQTERQRLVDELTTIYDATGDAQQFLLALNGSSKTMELGSFPSPASSAETVEALEECVSCGNTANYSLTPCRHRAYCSTCVWDDMRENPNCPICKTTWTGIKKDFELRPSGLLVCAPVLTTATQAAINIEAQRRHAPVPDTYRLPPSSSGASSLELPAPVYGTAGYSSPLPDIPLPIVPHKEYGVPVQNFGPPNTNIEYGSSAPAL